MLSFLSFFASAWGFLKDNKKLILPAILILCWVGSLWYVHRRTAATVAQEWRDRIANAPQTINTTYPTLPATVKPVSGWVKPKPVAQTVVPEQRPGAGLPEMPEVPDSVQFVGNLEVEVADTNLNFKIPFKLTVVGENVLGYNLVAEAFQLPTKLTIVDHLIMEPRPWYSDWLIALAAIGGILFGQFVF